MKLTGIKIVAEGSNFAPDTLVIPPPPSLIYSNEVLADEPILYFKLDESSGTIAADSSGFPHGFDSDATIFGGVSLDNPTLIDDPGGSFIFDPVSQDQYIKTLAAFGGIAYPTLSLECWVRENSLVTGQTLAAFMGVFGYNRSFMSLYTNGFIGDNVGFSLGAMNNFDGASMTLAVDLNGDIAYSTFLPHHVVGVWDGTNLILYVDGVVSSSYAADPDVIDFTDMAAYLHAGGDADGSSGGRFGTGGGLDGSLSQVAVYNTALSPERVLAHYNAGIG